jgi:DedD protein
MAEQELAPKRIADDIPVDMKKRARRRLVGATGLALLAVIVLPMVMDQEPKPTSQDIQIRIPSQDGSTFTSRILPSKPASTPLPPVQPTPRETVVAPPAPLPAPTAAAAEAKPEVRTAPKSEAKPAITAAVAPAEKVPAAAETKPVETSQPKRPEEARAAVILGGGETTQSTQWVVQLGAYQDQGNVKLLQKKVKELALPFYTEKVDTALGPRIRARAGPFDTREAAEQAQRRLKRIAAGGPGGGVVAPK